MSQPVRKQILEKHPDANEETFVTVLVDGGSLLRQCFKDSRVNTNGIHYGGVFQFLLQLRELLKKISTRIEYVYVFFDAHDSGILRYQIYPEYKANRDKDYAEHSNLSDYMKEYNAYLAQMQNHIYKKKEKPVKELTPAEKVVKENFDRERDLLCKYFNELYIRWMIDEKTEGDDLISYYVHHKLPNEKVVIMSADEDLTQLISETVCVYNNIKKKFFSTQNFKRLKGFPHENVVLRKIFLGDSSDNIGNIKGVSETRLLEMMPEIADRPVTVDEVRERARQLCEERVQQKKKPLQWQQNIVDGVANKIYNGDFYDINNRLINLDSPLLTEEAEKEISEMMHNVQDPEGRTFENLYSYMLEDGIDELSDSDRFSFFFEPYKPLIDKEVKRFKKEMSK